MEISKKSLVLNLIGVLIYQSLHLAKSLPFTDASMKMRGLSVNPHHNGQKFTDKSLGNAGLSVKYVLITDKSSKTEALSVNSSEILDKLV